MDYVFIPHYMFLHFGVYAVDADRYRDMTTLQDTELGTVFA